MTGRLDGDDIEVTPSAFRPNPTGDELAEVRAAYDPVGIDVGAPDALAGIDPIAHRIVSYVGKLIVSKGLDLLFAAWPLVVDRVPDARLLVIGFGTYRDALGRFVEALRRADVEALREIATRGRAPKRIRA